MNDSAPIHVSVMLDEVLAQLDPCVGQTVVDGTLGGGGHTRALAERVGPTGLVLALGLLTPLLAIDNGLNALAGWLGRSQPGLVLIGSGAAVVIAYVIRFLAVPTGFLKAGFERIPRDYDDSARAAGAGQTTTMRMIHLPLLRPAMLGAVIVVFVDCLKELPATLLLRPLNVETLATSIYQYASRGSFEEGALAALLIVAASIGPVAWLTRFSDIPSGPA